jgi:hypothetical protein
MVSQTRQGIPGDPLNVGLVGNRADIVSAMHAAGWYPADAITLRTSAEIIGSVLLDRPYRDAPVSNLFYDGLKEASRLKSPKARARTGVTTCGFGGSSKAAPKIGRSGLDQRHLIAALG